MLTYEQKQKQDEVLPKFRPNSTDKVEHYREKTVDALHTGADTARVMAGRASQAARRTGDKLDDAADCIENYDVSRAPGDVGRWLKTHPVPILAAAAVVGFFLARSLRRAKG